MDAPRREFETVEGERVGPQKTIPSYQVQRTMIITIRVKVTLFFDFDQDLSLAGVGNQFLRRPDVAFEIGRVFQKLPELIAIAFNGPPGRGGLDDQHPKGTCLKLD